MRESEVQTGVEFQQSIEPTLRLRSERNRALAESPATLLDGISVCASAAPRIVRECARVRASARARLSARPLMLAV